jgi:hypothetical protein
VRKQMIGIQFYKFWFSILSGVYDMSLWLGRLGQPLPTFRREINKIIIKKKLIIEL